MTRILFIDDTPSRLGLLHDLLRKASIGAEVTIVHRLTADSVTDEDVLAADVVFFDHDLCEGPGWSPCPRTKSTERCECPTGFSLAERLVMAGIGPRRAVVQSANAPGAARIAGTLKGAGWQVVVSPIDRWSWYVSTTLLRSWGIAAEAAS